jgi:hypothetical protein
MCGTCVTIPTTGLKVVRAVIYIDPDRPLASEKDREKQQLEDYLR